MPTGAIALERFQAGLETVRGTAVPATRRVYGQRGSAFFTPNIKKELLAESMGTYIKNYRHLVTGVESAFTFPGYLTASDFAWWGQLFFKGAVTGVLSATTVYTYTFVPTPASDDLKTATFEASTDTQGYQFPYCLGNTLDITWAQGTAALFNAGLIAQQYLPATVTAAIADRVTLNPLAGTNVTVYIDNAGGTIGTTIAGTVLGGKISWNNAWMAFTTSKGNLYYDSAVRDTRSIALDLDVYFTNTTELAQLQGDGERLIRVKFTGPTIAGSAGSVPESIIVDFYGYYLTGAFSANNAIRMVKLTAESQYDTTAATDWSVAVANSNVTLP